MSARKRSALPLYAPDSAEERHAATMLATDYSARVLALALAAALIAEKRGAHVPVVLDIAAAVKP